MKNVRGKQVQQTNFLTCVSHTAHVIDIGWTSVPSVCPSLVTRWYCVKMAQPIVKLSSVPGSQGWKKPMVFKIRN